MSYKILFYFFPTFTTTNRLLQIYLFFICRSLPYFYFTVFSSSGFNRTVCGGNWGTSFTSATGTNGRYGCCDAGSYMSSPFLNPFVKATACSSCHSGPPGQYTASSNAFISCSPNTVCGKQVGGATRLTGASRTVAGTCAPCAANTYAADGSTDCQPNTVCGNQVNGTARLTGASRTVAGTCAVCAANTYAADGSTDCQLNTVCGKQVGGATRLLTGASRTVAGTCAACAANTHAADDSTDCQPNTVCGKQVDGSARLTGDSRTVAGSCAPCAANTYAADDASDCTTPLSPSSKEEENLSPSSTEEENLSPSPSSTEEDDSVFDSDLNSAMKSNQNTSAVWFILFIAIIFFNFM